jgi:hypothetical protein
MTDERMQEALQQIEGMLNNPGLAPFIQELPSGTKVMDLESVKSLLLAFLVSTDEAMQQVLDMIKQA